VLPDRLPGVSDRSIRLSSGALAERRYSTFGCFCNTTFEMSSLVVPSWDLLGPLTQIAFVRGVSRFLSHLPRILADT